MLVIICFRRQMLARRMKTKSQPAWLVRLAPSLRRTIRPCRPNSPPATPWNTASKWAIHLCITKTSRVVVVYVYIIWQLPGFICFRICTAFSVSRRWHCFSLCVGGGCMCVYMYIYVCVYVYLCVCVCVCAALQFLSADAYHVIVSRWRVHYLVG